MTDDLTDDWNAVEGVLNAASAGASEPFYSQVEEAKASLFRLGCAATGCTCWPDEASAACCLHGIDARAAIERERDEAVRGRLGARDRRRRRDLGGRMSRLLCRLLGHRWRDAQILYEYGTTLATVGEKPPERVPVTWVSDERCGRCGERRWWPS